MLIIREAKAKKVKLSSLKEGDLFSVSENGKVYVRFNPNRDILDYISKKAKTYKGYMVYDPTENILDSFDDDIEVYKLNGVLNISDAVN